MGHIVQVSNCVNFIRCIDWRVEIFWRLEEARGMDMCQQALSTAAFLKSEVRGTLLQAWTLLEPVGHMYTNCEDWRVMRAEHEGSRIQNGRTGLTAHGQLLIYQGAHSNIQIVKIYHSLILCVGPNLIRIRIPQGSNQKKSWVNGLTESGASY